MNTKTISFGQDKWLTVNYTDKIISTHYGNDHVAHATRDVTYDNIQEAHQQGYVGDSAVWDSLLDHEILHNILPMFLLDEDGWVLPHESGYALQPYALRLYEEALVLSFQRWMNTGIIDPALWTYSPTLLNKLKEYLDTYKIKLLKEE